MLRVIAATANPDKLKEISAIMSSFEGEKIEVLPRPEGLQDTEETGATLEENALLKARHVFEELDDIEELEGDDEGELTPLFIIADDTGLEVEALDGQPGVRTARFAGENATYSENTKKLLQELEGVKNRNARFVSLIVALFVDGLELVTCGIVEGKIAEAPRGKRGFGYDPVFIPDGGDGRTFAEMTSQEKDSLSHRKRALESLKEILGEIRE